MVGLKDRASSQQAALAEGGSKTPTKPAMKAGAAMPQLMKSLKTPSGSLKQGAGVTPSPKSRLPGASKGSPSVSKTKKPGATATSVKTSATKTQVKSSLGEEERVLMDLARRPKDKNFKHVFKGSVLVTTLLEYNKDRFEGREAAVKFAQKLLDAGHVQSVVGSTSFDDGAALYRWGDESVVKEAKKMVATTSSHIPKKRIIEMMDLQQGAGNEAAFHVKDVKSKFTAKKTTSETRKTVTSPTGSDIIRRRSVDRRYSDHISTPKPRARANSTEFESRLPRAKARSNSIDSNIDRTPTSRYAASPAGSTGAGHTSSVSGSSRHAPSSATTSRSSTPRSPVSPSPVNPAPRTKPHSPSIPQLSEPITFTVQMDSRPAPTPTRPSVSTHSTPTMMTASGPTHTEIITPTPIHIHTEVFVPVMTTRFETPTFHAPSRTYEAPVSNVQQAYERGRHDTSPSPEPPAPRSATMSPASVFSEPPQHSEHRYMEVRGGQEARSPSVQSRESPAPVEQDPFSTCRYDGIEMPALDIDSIDFQFPRPGPATHCSTAEDLEKSMADLMDQSNCYSDNEKQLLEQMKKMKQEHQSQLKSYEEQINELMDKMNGLKGLAEILESRQAGEEEERVNPSEPEAPVAETAPPPPPPPPMAPPAPPLPLSSVPAPPAFSQPSKPPIKPRVKMRPLFWTRLILHPALDNRSTFWHCATEPNFDVDEFERLFGRQIETNNNNPKSLHDAMTPHKNKGKQQAVKLLEDNRSRAVGIKLRSMHCQMEDIKRAVYGLDFSGVDLDSVQGVYEIRGTAEELEKINTHLHEHTDELLDQPEQFLYEISQMPNFAERIECLAFIKRFKETVFNIDERLGLVQQGCGELGQNEYLRSLLESILSFGNYMNGGTQRGQADGFDLTILPKLKDVKSMDNGINLLHYIARVNCKELGDAVGRGGATCGVPEPAAMAQAAGVGFPELEAELRGLKSHLDSHRTKASDVTNDSPEDLLQPFKDRMDDFFESAEHMLKDQEEKCKDTKESFEGLVRHYTAKPPSDQISVESFFKTWAVFFTDYKNFWKEEQKRIAKAMFEKVDQKRKDRLKMAKRRKSIAVSAAEEAPNNNLKQRFAQLRRRSEAQPPNMRLLRSTSVNSLDASVEAERSTSPGIGNTLLRGSRDSLLSHTRPKSDANAYPIYQNLSPEYRGSMDRLIGPSHSPSSEPPPLPSTPPPDLHNPPTTYSYRREVSLPPPSSPQEPDPIDSVFERMERRRRRGVVVVDPAAQPEPEIQGVPPATTVHPLHERIRRRRSRNSSDGMEGDGEMNGMGSAEQLNAFPVQQYQEQSPRQSSDGAPRAGPRPMRAGSGMDGERKQPRTLPAPPVPVRDGTQAGEFIGSYNVRTASEQRAREERTVREQNDSPTSPYPVNSLRHSYPPPDQGRDPGLSPLRESRCSSPCSTTSSHSSLDSSRPPRMLNMPRLLERAVSDDRDLGTLSEHEYRDALRRSARARVNSSQSLR